MPGSSRSMRLLGLEVQRRVPAPGIDPHHPHAAVEQPVRRLGGHAGPADHVVGLVEERVAAGAHEHDVALAAASWPDARELRTRRRRGRPRRRPPWRVKSSTTPGARNHSSGSSSIVCAGSPRMRRVVVPGSVDVGGVVRAEAGELLHRPALAVAQQVARHAEQRLDVGRALRVVAEARSRSAGARASRVGTGRSGLRGRRAASPRARALPTARLTSHRIQGRGLARFLLRRGYPA